MKRRTWFPRRKSDFIGLINFDRTVIPVQNLDHNIHHILNRTVESLVTHIVGYVLNASVVEAGCGYSKYITIPKQMCVIN
jgi:hypothetical protein